MPKEKEIGNGNGRTADTKSSAKSAGEIKAIIIGVQGRQIDNLLKVAPQGLGPHYIRLDLEHLAEHAHEIMRKALDGQAIDEEAEAFKSLCEKTIAEAAATHSSICESAAEGPQEEIEKKLCFISLASFVLEAITFQLNTIKG